MTYGQQLHARRKRLGLTQAGAASLLGVGVSTYCAWERDDPQRTPLAVTQEGALARLDAASAAPKRTARVKQAAMPSPNDKDEPRPLEKL